LELSAKQYSSKQKINKKNIDGMQPNHPPSVAAQGPSLRLAKLNSAGSKKSVAARNN